MSYPWVVKSKNFAIQATLCPSQSASSIQITGKLVGGGDFQKPGLEKPNVSKQ